MSLTLLTSSAHLFYFLIVHLLPCTQNYFKFFNVIRISLFAWRRRMDGGMKCTTHFLSSSIFESRLKAFDTSKGFMTVVSKCTHINIRNTSMRFLKIVHPPTSDACIYSMRRKENREILVYLLIRDYYFVVDFIHTVRIKLIRTHSIFVLWRRKKTEWARWHTNGIHLINTECEWCFRRRCEKRIDNEQVRNSHSSKNFINLQAKKVQRKLFVFLRCFCLAELIGKPLHFP